MDEKERAADGRAAAGGADELAGALAVGVSLLGVAGRLLVVGGHERGQDLGRGAL